MKGIRPRWSPPRAVNQSDDASLYHSVRIALVIWSKPDAKTVSDLTVGLTEFPVFIVLSQERALRSMLRRDRYLNPACCACYLLTLTV
jgi:hypothetical protein